MRQVTSAANGGDWAVEVAFTPSGQQRFTALTARSVGQQLAMVVDGVVQSAPTVNETIQGDAVVSGDLTEADSHRLAAILAAGALPVPLKAAAATTTAPPGYRG